MVDAADRRRISHHSVGRLPSCYVRKTHMASTAVGEWYWLGYRSDCVVLGYGDYQAVLVAAGICGYLADSMGTTNAKAVCVRFRVVVILMLSGYPVDSGRPYTLRSVPPFQGFDDWHIYPQGLRPGLCCVTPSGFSVPEP